MPWTRPERLEARGFRDSTQSVEGGSPKRPSFRSRSRNLAIQAAIRPCTERRRHFRCSSRSLEVSACSRPGIRERHPQGSLRSSRPSQLRTARCSRRRPQLREWSKRLAAGGGSSCNGRRLSLRCSSRCVQAAACLRRRNDKRLLHKLSPRLEGSPLSEPCKIGKLEAE